MKAIGQVILATAGANYASRKNNKYASQAFDQRMQDAEKYGIHPLQALGGNANFQGTGGSNVGNILNDNRAMKKAEARADMIREDQQMHEQQMQKIKDSAENIRLTRRLEAEAKSPLAGDNIMDLKNKFGKYWGPGGSALIDTFTDAGDSAGEWIDNKWNDIQQHMWDTRRNQLKRRQ
jgi:hypothetical protein